MARRTDADGQVSHRELDDWLRSTEVEEELSPSRDPMWEPLPPHQALHAEEPDGSERSSFERWKRSLPERWPSEGDGSLDEIDARYFGLDAREAQRPEIEAERRPEDERGDERVGDLEDASPSPGCAKKERFDYDAAMMCKLMDMRRRERENPDRRAPSERSGRRSSSSGTGSPVRVNRGAANRGSMPASYRRRSSAGSSRSGHTSHSSSSSETVRTKNHRLSEGEHMSPPMYQGGQQYHRSASLPNMGTCGNDSCLSHHIDANQKCAPIENTRPRLRRRLSREVPETPYAVQAGQPYHRSASLPDMVGDESPVQYTANNNPPRHSRSDPTSYRGACDPNRSVPQVNLVNLLAAMDRSQASGARTLTSHDRIRIRPGRRFLELMRETNESRGMLISATFEVPSSSSSESHRASSASFSGRRRTSFESSDHPPRSAPPARNRNRRRKSIERNIQHVMRDAMLKWTASKGAKDDAIFGREDNNYQTTQSADDRRSPNASSDFRARFETPGRTGDLGRGDPRSDEDAVRAELRRIEGEMRLEGWTMEREVRRESRYRKGFR
ncbi:hypothetical protein ACHAWF_011465 [Thalassiosira exigua]